MSRESRLSVVFAEERSLLRALDSLQHLVDYLTAYLRRFIFIDLRHHVLRVKEILDNWLLCSNFIGSTLESDAAVVAFLLVTFEQLWIH